MSRRTPLWAQLLVIALTGGLVVAVVTAALAVPLVRSVARSQARTELARSVDALAATPQATARLLVKERRAVGPDDRSYSLLTARDGLVGEASGVLSGAQIASLRAHGTLSTTTHQDGKEVLVEGRRTRRTGLFAIGVQPVAAVDQATTRLLWQLALALVIGLLTAGALSLVVTRRIARPVSRTADSARRLAAGERGLEATDSSIAEVFDMSLALSALDDALATSEGRQREFLLSISHELRTPLTAIRGYAEALRDGAIGPDRAVEVGATLTAETERLEVFITDLLALARLEADDFRLEKVPVDLDVLLFEAVRAWAARAHAGGVRLSSYVDPGSALTSDPLRIRQLVDGLVENALRVTPPGGSVRLTGSVDGGYAVIAVADTGPGLSGDEHGVAFQRGVLRDAYAGQRPVGTGLGLSIARRLTERMGGGITAAPADPAGTVMTVRLRTD